jgi:hypothetical protein
MLSYTVMSAIAYLVELIKFKLTKKGEGEEVEAPKWNVSVVALIVTALFIVYFFVPTVV